MSFCKNIGRQALKKTVLYIYIHTIYEQIMPTNEAGDSITSAEAGDSITSAFIKRSLNPNEDASTPLAVKIIMPVSKIALGIGLLLFKCPDLVERITNKHFNISTPLEHSGNITAAVSALIGFVVVFLDKEISGWLKLSKATSNLLWTGYLACNLVPESMQGPTWTPITETAIGASATFAMIIENCCLMCDHNLTLSDKLTKEWLNILATFFFAVAIGAQFISLLIIDDRLITIIDGGVYMAGVSTAGIGIASGCAFYRQTKEQSGSHEPEVPTL